MGHTETSWSIKENSGRTLTTAVVHFGAAAASPPGAKGRPGHHASAMPAEVQRLGHGTTPIPSHMPGPQGRGTTAASATLISPALWPYCQLVPEQSTKSGE